MASHFQTGSSLRSYTTLKPNRFKVAPSITPLLPTLWRSVKHPTVGAFLSLETCEKPVIILQLGQAAFQSDQLVLPVNLCGQYLQQVGNLLEGARKTANKTAIALSESHKSLHFIDVFQIHPVIGPFAMSFFTYPCDPFAICKILFLALKYL